MSGIVGMLNRDGAPADRDLLLRMARRMAGRAPDGIGVWTSGHVGLGLATLNIPGEPVEPDRPYSLDGKVWIVADARIDGREELTDSLRASGQIVATNASSATLILLAYRVFAEAFLERLVGDFAFALWDAEEKKLICARDHFGVRPFFYANKGNVLLFASDALGLLESPLITSEPDEEALGDLLFFGGSQDPQLSAYRDIRRLPGAHQLFVVSGGPMIRRYWTIPLDDEIRYRRDSDYVDHFAELFGRAVDDRSRASRIAFELSGGLDSTSVAAVAAPRRRGSEPTMGAYSVTCDRLLPDDREGYYAGLVATTLGIAHESIASEDYPLFAGLGQPQFRTAEPTSSLALAIHDAILARLVATGTRVLLTGQGGDIAFSGSSFAARDLLMRGRVVRLGSDLYRHYRATGTLAGSGLRAILRSSTPRTPSWQPDFPGWLDSDFVRRARLRERWASGWQLYHSSSDGRRLINTPWLSPTFEAYEVLSRPVVARHPFFDVRLIVFMLGLANYLKADKRLLRESMKEVLPEIVRVRPKTPLGGDLTRRKLHAGLIAFPIDSALGQIGGRFIVRETYLKAVQEYLTGTETQSTWPSWLLMGPIALDSWLTYHAPVSG